MLDQYEILEELGRGGMGVVHKARQISLNRVVALKMLLAGLHAGDKERARFDREADLVARLQHPNIVQVHEKGEADGIPFICMEFCEGGSLAKQLAGRPRPARDAALAVRQIAGAVAHAHAHQIVHRDLKPDNVMLTRDGTLKVTDFGLALLLEDHTRLTTRGAMLGTPGYMAPEQVAGWHDQLGPAADIYGLGAILYTMLTGRPPFVGRSLDEILGQVLVVEPIRPRRLEPDVPRDLETICLKCLEKNPRHRFASAAHLVADLDRFLDGEPIIARPIGSLARFGRWCGRNKLVAGLAGGAITLLVVAAVSASIAAFEFRSKADVEAKARADLEEQLYANRIAVAERELTDNHDVGLASTLLEQCPERLRGWEWDYLMRLRDGGRAPLSGHQGGLWTATFSPDGRRIVTASIDGTVKVWDAATGRALLSFHEHGIKLPAAVAAFAPAPPRVPVMCASFSPDGRFIASGSLAPRKKLNTVLDLLELNDLKDPRKAKGVVHVWDAETGRVAVTFDGQAGIVDTLAFSPDGTRIASSSISLETACVVWDTRTGKEVGTLRGHSSHVHRLRFSPDGRLIASGSTDGSVKLWDAATFQEVRTLAAHPAPVYDLAFSPDGRRIASASVDGTVGVWDTATGAAALKPLRGHTGAAMGVTFSPDGSRIATAGYDKTVRLWDAATGVEKITLRGHKELVTGVAFSPDGRQLVSAGFDREARIWDASPLAEVLVPGLFALGGHADRVNSVAFSADERLLASGSWDKTVRLWDARTGEPVRTLEGHEGAIWAVAFSPDGSRLASASWDRTVKIWDTASGAELLSYTGHPTPLQGVAFSPDGKSVASCSFDGLVKIWDAVTGADKAACAGHLFPAVAVAFSPDGKRVASGSGDRTVKVWDAQTGREVLTLKGHNALVNGVAFSPDGRHVASASWDQTAKVWDARTGKEVLTLKGHSDRVQGVAFSPDGSRIATAGEDKTVVVWDATTGEAVLPPRLHRGIVWSVAFSPDGKRVAAGGWAPGAWVKTWDAQVPARVGAPR